MFGNPTKVTSAERPKVNIDLWYHYVFFVSLCLTYKVRIMSLALTVFAKNRLVLALKQLSLVYSVIEAKKK